ncbi:MAG: type II toxin-antitoxin system prevent-host-death family antitoxin [Spirosomaceae bacterium]|nr:type II toxin-antitoxin system prevent-host-death family antitoxin [Spirosomataceae bacterium]
MLLKFYCICTYTSAMSITAVNYSEFRNGLKGYLDRVEDDNETLIIKRKTGKGSVLISMDEYNSIQETLHLLSSRKNAQRLYESIEQLKTGKKVQPDLDI